MVGVEGNDPSAPVLSGLCSTSELYAIKFVKVPTQWSLPTTKRLGGCGWSRTNNVYLKGPDLQSGDAHAIASTHPNYFGLNL